MASPTRTIEFDAKGSEWPIQNVTVYNDQAEIVRTLEFKPEEPGPLELRLKGLPRSFQSESVRAEVTSANATLVEVSYDSVWKEGVEDDETRERREKVEELTQTKLGLQKEIERLNFKNDFLQKYSKAVLPQNESALIDGMPACVSMVDNLDSIDNFMAFCTDKQEVFDNRQAEIIAEQKELQQEITFLTKNDKRSHGVQELNEVIILLDIPEETLENEGLVSLNLIYLVWNAKWTASYDIHVDKQQSKVILTYYGEVSNNTGENWNEISMSLSTARPSAGGNLPTLPISNVRFKEHQNQMQEQMLLQQQGRNRQMSMAMRSDMMAQQMSNFAFFDVPQVQQRDEGRRRLQSPQTSSSGGSNAVFNIQRQVSIESDGLEHKQTIAIIDMEALLTHAASPKVSAEKVYLKCSARNVSEYPILPGLMKIFMNGYFLAESYTELVRANEEFVVFLGVDESVKVELKPVQKKNEKSTGGVMKGKPKKTRRVTYQRVIRNTSADVVRFVLYEQLPVSQDGKIKVDLIKPDLKKKLKDISYKLNSFNHVEARRTIQPNSEWRFMFEYLLEWPADDGDVTVYETKIAGEYTD
uniref:DUF4139 domain-containing protein n=1 Tax=Aplanochytrium stocchinoi TaxID=215587 RepID=A0A7S3LT89_9STRA